MPRGKMPSTSPLERSMRVLRREGWLVAKVEQWIPSRGGGQCNACGQLRPRPGGPPGIRRDLFGIGDAIAIREHETLLVQACPMSRMGDHLATITTALVKDPRCAECRKPKKTRTCYGHNAAGLWLAGEIAISEELMLAVAAALKGWTDHDDPLTIAPSDADRMLVALGNLNASGPRRLEIWGWRKLTPRGKQAKWAESIRNVTTDDLQDLPKGTVPVEVLGDRAEEAIF